MKSTIASCGMNCELCHTFQDKSKNCPGCRSRATNCVIWNCDKKQEYCFECPKFPCKRLKELDERYRTKYGMSMLENLEYIKNKGEEAFIKNQNEKYTYPLCGKLRTVHYDYCIYCKQTKTRKHS